MKPTVGLLIKKYTMKWDTADKYTEHLILTDTWQDLQSPWRQFPGSICKSVSKRSNWNKKAYPKCGCSPSQGVECQTEFKSEQTTPQRSLSASCLWYNVIGGLLLLPQDVPAVMKYIPKMWAKIAFCVTAWEKLANTYMKGKALEGKRHYEARKGTPG